MVKDDVLKWWFWRFDLLATCRK